MKNKFTKDDVEKLTEFLNITAQKATFDVDIPDMIKIVKLLGHIQNKTLPMIKEHILELVAVHTNEESEPS